MLQIINQHTCSYRQRDRQLQEELYESGWGRLFAGEEGGEGAHSFGGGGLYDMHSGDGRGVGGGRVYVVYGCARAYALYQAGGRIDHERGAYHDEYVCLVHELDGFLDIGHRLLKEDYMRTHEVTVTATGGGSGLKMVDVERLGVFGIADGADLHQFAVEMEHIF